jgi:hypothetical protein
VQRSTTSAAATSYICIDCGYIYDGSIPFEKLPRCALLFYSISLPAS